MVEMIILLYSFDIIKNSNFKYFWDAKIVISWNYLFKYVMKQSLYRFRLSYYELDQSDNYLSNG